MANGPASTSRDNSSLLGLQIGFFCYRGGAEVCLGGVAERIGLPEAILEPLQLLLESAPVMVFAFDAVGVVTYSSGKGLEAVGRGAGDSIGQSVFDLYARVPFVIDAAKRALRGEVVRTGGDLGGLWFEGQLAPVRDHRGEVAGAVGMAFARRPHLLPDSQERLRLLTDHLPGVLWTLDKNLHITSDAGAGLRGLGWTEGEQVGKSLSQLVGTDDPDFAPIRACRAALEGRSSSYELRFLGRDFVTRVEPIERNGEVVGVIGLSLDITEQKEAERQALATSSLLRSTLESTADGIFVVNRDKKMVLLNQRLIAMWHIPKDVVERSDDEAAFKIAFAQVEDKDAVLARVREIYEHPEMESFDVLRLMDGRVIERYSQPQRMGEEIVGRVWSFRDVTLAAKLDHLKDQFVKTAAHELMTPLAVIKAHAQLLQKLGVSADGLRGLEAISRGTDRLQHIVQDLLDITELQTGNMMLLPTHLDMVAVTQRVLKREAGAHAFNVSAAADVMTVWADPVRVERVLGVLCDNAFRYSGATAAVRVSLAAEGPSVHVCVEDQGIGIPFDRQPHIFGRFYRAHAGTPQDFGGLGVGLYISRAVVRRLGGEMWFQSVEGQGSRFHFTLPKEPA